MVDILSAAAEIRRGKKDRRRKKPQSKNVMACPITQGGIINILLSSGFMRGLAPL